MTPTCQPDLRATPAGQKRTLPLNRRYGQLVACLLAIYWIALFAGTHYPDAPQVGSDSSDKWMHALAFGGLSVLLAATIALRRPLARVHYLQVVLVLAIYGAFDELTQPPFGRHCELSDWISDMIGVFIGLTVVMAVSRLRRQCVQPGDDATI